MLIICLNSVEATVMIIAACIPTLRPVFLHFMSGNFSHNDKLPGHPELNFRTNMPRLKNVITDIYSTKVRDGADTDSTEDILPLG